MCLAAFPSSPNQIISPYCSGSQKELDLIESFRKDENQMNMEISSRTSKETFIGLEEKVYKVDITGASVSSAYSISLLHHYCSKLPHDEYDFLLTSDFKPLYIYIYILT